MQPLFVYGTLLDPDVFLRVTGAPLSRMRGERAQLDGHAAVYAYGKPFPILVPAPGATTEGLLLAHLDARHHRALDDYEGREWTKRPVTVKTARGPADALAYVSETYRPSREKFAIRDWQRRLKRAYLAAL